MADFEITMPVSISPKIEIEMPVTVNLITLPYDTNLRLSEIPGTTKTTVSDPDTSKPLYVTYTSGNDTIRTDIFLYTESVTWEIRYLADGKALAIRTKKGEQGQKVYYEVPESGTNFTIPNILRDNITLSMFQTLVRAMPGLKPLPVGSEIKMPWTPSEGGKTYDNYMVLVDYGYYVKEEDAATGTQTWMGVFRQKGAHATTMVYDAPEQELATEETAIDGLYYYGKSSSTSFSLIDLSAGDPIPYDDYQAVYHNEILDTSSSKYIVQYGYTRYSHSAHRQWMNSSAGPGEWWTAQHIGDCPPANIESRRGFMAGLRSEDIAAVQKVKIASPRRDGTVDYTYDKFWAPCAKEMYGVEDSHADASGISDWSDYWHDFIGLSEPKNNYSSATDRQKRIIKGITGSSLSNTQSIALRSEIYNLSAAILALATGSRSSGGSTVYYYAGNIFGNTTYSNPSVGMVDLICCCVG